MVLSLDILYPTNVHHSHRVKSPSFTSELMSEVKAERNICLPRISDKNSVDSGRFGQQKSTPLRNTFSSLSVSLAPNPTGVAPFNHTKALVLEH